MLNQMLSRVVSVAITLSVAACTTNSPEQIFKPDISIETENPNDEVISEDNIMQTIEIIINNEVFTAQIYDNETAKAFISTLPITLDMKDLNNNEKYCYLSDSLVTNTFYPKQIYSGDLMLYGSNCLVLFYESFSTSYGYTSIGKIEDITGLKQAIGNGDIQITFKLK